MPAPPLLWTNWVSTGTNLPTMSGDSPSFWNDCAAEAKPPTPPGKELERLEIPGMPPAFELTDGAAFKKPLMPGTTADILLKSAALKLLLANPKSAPAPPVACEGVTESCLVSAPTSSGLGVFAAVVTAFCACVCPATVKITNRTEIRVRKRLTLVLMFPPS